MRILAGSSKEVDSIGRVVSRNTQPASVMVWAGVSATGRTPLVFVEKGVKINAESYLEDILKKHLIPWAHSHYGEAECTFQQDSAPAHKAKRTQDWCRLHLPNFIAAEEWPANSPDLNVMDYRAWAILEEKACSTRHSSVESLKSSLKKAWDEIPQEVLQRAVDSYSGYLKAVVKAKGGHIE